MDKLEQLLFLNDFLQKEMPQYEKQGANFEKTIPDQRILLRSLMNLRPARPLDPEFLAVQDAFLSQEVEEKGTISLDDLSPHPHEKNLYLWRGDITTLKVDAIVNAGNSALLGCFAPCHGCIDNAIHSVAGLQLRDQCSNLMKAQDHPEETGKAKLTKGYNLPATHVIHTVGPIISGELEESHCTLLQNCYKSSLELAVSHNLTSIAFCCISTGEFHFPPEKACDIAVDTVLHFLKSKEMKVIFNVFTENDHRLYQRRMEKIS